MSARLRSPNYPSTPLPQAIDLIEKIFDQERTNAVDREVAAQALGYSGVSGRSAKVLSNLLQFGLLEKAGKNEVRVSKRAVEILHPDTPESKAAAIREAGLEPELFQKVSDRFPDGCPSEAALRSYFTKEEFTNRAIPSAIRAYLETYLFLEESVNKSSKKIATAHEEKHEEFEHVRLEAPTTSSVPNQNTSQVSHKPHLTTDIVGGEESDPQFVWSNKKIWLLGGVVSTKQQADEMISFIQAVKGMLPNEPSDSGSQTGHLPQTVDTQSDE